MSSSIDVMSYEPAFLKTKLVEDYKHPFEMIEPARGAEVSLRDLGTRRQTYGAFRHYVAYWIANLIPILAI